MSMKKFVLASLLMASLPFLVLAQSVDDLYYIPKKKVDKKEKVASSTPKKVVAEQGQSPTTVYASPGSTVVIKDVKGNVRDLDEYNRRYTSRDNTFSMENDTLYIEEKPYAEQGEWVNGFEGSDSDYEYAMRIVRFRNPRFAIPISSPLYWDVVYTLPSWEWNVYDDGFYAYAFPTYSNPLWWNWRFNYSWSWGWHSPWHYSYWCGPSYWHGSHWYHPHWHHSHHYPHYGWGGVGGYWGGGHKWHGSSAINPGIHAGRYANNKHVATSGSNRRPTVSGNRSSRESYVNRVRQNDNRNRSVTRSSGRVVTAKDGSSSVRPQRTAVRNRNSAVQKETSTGRSSSTYTRPSQGRSSTYNRQSSTRSTVNRSTPSYQKKSEATERSSYRSRSSNTSESRSSSYSSGRSSSSSRSSSYSSGGGSSRSSSAGSSRSGGGSSSRGGGRR